MTYIDQKQTLMTSNDQKQTARHPFLDDLAAEVTLVTNVLSAPVHGREHVLRVVRAGAGLYMDQKPSYLRDIDQHRTLFEYDARLLGGGDVHGVVIIDKNAAGQVIHLNIGFSPQGGAMNVALRLSQLLNTDHSITQNV